MKRFLIFSIVVVLLAGGIADLAKSQQISPPVLLEPSPAFGLGVSLPLYTVVTPPNTITTAITFIDLLAQASLTQDIATRGAIRLYLSATMLRLDLTSFQGSLLIFLTQGPARFYVGGGIGTFPYESSSFAPGVPGLLFSLHELIGIRVTTNLFSIFAEIAYEAMPQAVAFGTGTISSVQLTVGAMINLGARICPCTVPKSICETGEW